MNRIPDQTTLSSPYFAARKSVQRSMEVHDHGDRIPITIEGTVFIRPEF